RRAAHRAERTHHADAGRRRRRTGRPLHRRSPEGTLAYPERTARRTSNAAATVVSALSPSWVPENLRVKELQGELLAVRTSVICALNQLLDLKDLNPGVHSTRLAEWSVRSGH